MSDTERTALVQAIVDAAEALKAEDLVALDVRALTSYTDTFVIATASSDRRARAIADSVIEAVKQLGTSPFGVEGYDEGRWVLIDLGDVIVHVFQEDVRREYDIEGLWIDAPPVACGTSRERTAVS